MARIKVVGYMEYSQFEEHERDVTKPSGLTEMIELDLIEDFSTDLDDVTLTYDENNADVDADENVTVIP